MDAISVAHGVPVDPTAAGPESVGQPPSPSNASIMSAEAAWGLDPQDEHAHDAGFATSTFKHRVTVEFQDKVLKKYGGPLQYLKAMLQTEQSKGEFATWLTAQFPQSPTENY